MDGLVKFLDHSGELCQSSEDMINSLVVNNSTESSPAGLHNATAAQLVTSEPIGNVSPIYEYASCAEVRIVNYRIVLYKGFRGYQNVNLRLKPVLLARDNKTRKY